VIRVLKFYPLLLCASLMACASPAETYYQLSASAVAHARRDSTVSLEVGPVSLPAGLDRPQLVLLEPNGQLNVLEQSRWLAPLSRMLPQVLAVNLARETGLSQIHAFPQASSLPSDFRLLLDIRALQATPAQGVYLEASWSVQHQGKTLAVGSMSDRFAVSGRSINELVHAQDQALAALARRIAATLPQGMRP
jgi:uncharacterized lipoprotein YmbA